MSLTQQQLREIMERNAAALTLYARQFLEFHSAEEVVQDSFFRLFREKVTPENPTNWLYKTVRNGAISRLRSEKRRQKRENERKTVPWFHSDTVNRLETVDFAEKITEKLQSLDPGLREILTLHIWGERSFAEIGELLGKSKATVFRRYQDGIQTLRLLFDEEQL